MALLIRQSGINHDQSEDAEDYNTRDAHNSVVDAFDTLSDAMRNISGAVSGSILFATAFRPRCKP